VGGPVSFLTPLAAVVALVGLVPVAVFLRRERRAVTVRRVLRLAEPPSTRRTWLLSAIVATAVLSGIAAAQPVIDRSSAQSERTDAEIFFAFDTSRSMLAAEGADDPTRLERAHALASEIRSQLPDVPAGIAQFTDWTVPHLFPTVDPSTFRHVMERSVYVESLGSRETSVVATDLSALSALAGDSYFSPTARKRLLVVLTDGESAPVRAELGRLSSAGIRVRFVHLWGGDESIWRPRGAEPQYRPDASSRRTLMQAAVLVEGAVVAEKQAIQVVRWARGELGEGPTRLREQRDLLALMPYVLFAAAIPLGLLLRTRNV
jgi:hypothetical protein